MKTIASILVCMLAMVCFSANAADFSEAFERTKENARANSFDWHLYTTPVSENTVGNYVEDINKEKCTCNGIKMYGKVKLVEHFPDIEVQLVEHFPDLTIKYIEHFPDIKIKFVESFLGM